MEDKKFKRKAGFHYACIIPAGPDTFGFDFQWPDVLTPLTDDFSLLELAVYKALYLGADSIWVSIQRKGYSLIREKIGEYCKSDMKGSIPPSMSYNHKIVPIYYWQRSYPKRRKYNYAWSIIRAAEKASTFTVQASDHLRPDLYFVSYPGCIYNPLELKKCRGQKKPRETAFESDDRASIENESLMDFSFYPETSQEFRKELVRANSGFVSQKEIRESGRGIKEIFSKEFSASENVGVGPSHRIKEWEDYCRCLGDFDFSFLDELDEDLVDPTYTHRDLSYEGEES